jgi:hypothetical protein
MLAKLQPVHSWLHGFGQVQSDDGGEVTVRFLHGMVRSVPRASLTPLAEAELDDEVANRAEWDTFTLVYCYGAEALPLGGRMWVRDREGFWTSPELLDKDTEPLVPPPELEAEARPVTAAEARQRTDIINCRVRRVNDFPYLCPCCP